jgi:hypothetical protein
VYCCCTRWLRTILYLRPSALACPGGSRSDEHGCRTRGSGAQHTRITGANTAGCKVCVYVCVCVCARVCIGRSTRVTDASQNRLQCVGIDIVIDVVTHASQVAAMRCACVCVCVCVSCVLTGSMCVCVCVVLCVWVCCMCVPNAS